MRCKNAIHLKRAAAALLPLWRESVCKGIFYKLYQHDGFHLLSLCSFVQLDFSISISGIDFLFFLHFFVFANDFRLPSEDRRELVRLRAGDGGKKEVEIVT